MMKFVYNGKIISTNVVNFTKRYYILDELLIGSDCGLIAIYDDGTVEILYFDCMNPNYCYSSEEFEPIALNKNNLEQIKKSYADTLGDSYYLEVLNDDIKELRIDL